MKQSLSCSCAKRFFYLGMVLSLLGIHAVLYAAEDGGAEPTFADVDIPVIANVISGDVAVSEILSQANKVLEQAHVRLVLDKVRHVSSEQLAEAVGNGPNKAINFDDSDTLEVIDNIGISELNAGPGRGMKLWLADDTNLAESPVDEGGYGDGIVDSSFTDGIFVVETAHPVREIGISLARGLASQIIWNGITSDDEAYPFDWGSLFEYDDSDSLFLPPAELTSTAIEDYVIPYLNEGAATYGLTRRQTPDDVASSPLFSQLPPNLKYQPAYGALGTDPSGDPDFPLDGQATDLTFFRCYSSSSTGASDSPPDQLTCEFVVDNYRSSNALSGDVYFRAVTGDEAEPLTPDNAYDTADGIFGFYIPEEGAGYPASIGTVDRSLVDYVFDALAGDLLDFTVGPGENQITVRATLPFERLQAICPDFVPYVSTLEVLPNTSVWDNEYFKQVTDYLNGPLWVRPNPGLPTTVSADAQIPEADQTGPSILISNTGFPGDPAQLPSGVPNDVNLVSIFRATLFLSAGVNIFGYGGDNRSVMTVGDVLLSESAKLKSPNEPNEPNDAAVSDVNEYAFMVKEDGFYEFVIYSWFESLQGSLDLLQRLLDGSQVFLGDEADGGSPMVQEDLPAGPFDDRDGDGIEDSIDEQPDTPSSRFDNGKGAVIGEILDANGNTITIRPLDKEIVLVSVEGGTGPATIEFDTRVIDVFPGTSNMQISADLSTVE